VHRTRPVAWASIAAASFNVGLNLLLVPDFGITGAAIATVLAFCLQTRILRWALPATPVMPRSSRGLLSGIALACLVSGLSVLPPQDVAWMSGRFVLAVGCLPWFLLGLRRAQARERTAAQAQ
jgi:O-antigen/teichoic acid export membrane protein